MLKRLAAVFTTGMLAMSLCSCSLTYRDMVEEERSVPVPPKMVFLGDSIAAGYGLEGYSRDDLYRCDSYANTLGAEYTVLLAEECGHEMINDAVSGDTSQDLIDLLDSGKIDEDLRGSDAVVVSIGGNDVLHIIFAAAETLGWSEETQDFDFGRVDIMEAIGALTSMSEDIDAALEGFDNNLDGIISRIRQRTEGDIYVQTLYNPVEYFDNWKMLVDYSYEKIDVFNDIVRDHAMKDGEEQYKIIDVGTQFRGRNSQLTNMADYDIHPNADGHRVIADVVDRELRKGSYSYTVTVPGEEHLTGTAKALIAGGAAAAGLLIAAVIIVVIKKSSKAQS